MNEALTVLHAVSGWAVDLSAMAGNKAKSELVKEFASEVAATNAEKDVKLMELAKPLAKNGYGEYLMSLVARGVVK